MCAHAYVCVCVFPYRNFSPLRIACLLVRWETSYATKCVCVCARMHVCCVRAHMHVCVCVCLCTG